LALIGVPNWAASGLRASGGVLGSPAVTAEYAMMLLEYLQPETSPDRRADIRQQLMTYCELDTWATVEVLRVLRGECGLQK